MKLSIIIPIYNAENYVRKCLDSIFKDNAVEGMEVICVNDGSVDNSLQVIEDYIAQGITPPSCSIRIINQPNQGVSKARNEGLKEAKGEYVMFVDADDYISANTLMPFLEYAQETGCDLAIAGMRRVSRAGEKVEVKLKNNVYDSSNLYLLITELGSLIVSAPWLKLFRRDIIEKNAARFDESLPIFEDAVFVHKYLKCCSKVATSDIVFYNYILNGSSATAKFRGDAFTRCISMYRSAELDFINSQNISPERYQEVLSVINRDSAFHVLFAIYTIYRAPNRPRKGQYSALKKYADTFKDVLPYGKRVRGIAAIVFASLKIHPYITHCLLKIVFGVERCMKN